MESFVPGVCGSQSLFLFKRKSGSLLHRTIINHHVEVLEEGLDITFRFRRGQSAGWGNHGGLVMLAVAQLFYRGNDAFNRQRQTNGTNISPRTGEG